MDIVQIGNYAAAISAVMALLIACVYKPIKAIYTQYKADRKESQDADKEILKTLSTLSVKLDNLTNDVSHLEGDRLAQKHRYYMSRGVCSSAEKAETLRWYESYTAKGGNHLAKTYVEDIMSLPEE